MSKKPMTVDRGTMHLTVGEEQVQGGDNPSSEMADPLHVQRFSDSLNQNRRRPQQAPDEPEELPSPFALFGGPEPGSAPDGEAVALAIEQAWVNNGAAGVREVRFHVSGRLLRDAVVRIFEGEGRLQIAMSTEVQSTARWLEDALPRLGDDLRNRLRRPLRLALTSSRLGQPVTLDLDWSDES